MGRGRRTLTVEQLRALLADFPDHYPTDAVDVVQGTASVDPLAPRVVIVR